ncbi:MAG: TAT-variant-translocated molybdopterin oxidoreductase [Acidobacteriota bacterium]
MSQVERMPARIEELRARLASERGPRFWRSLEALADDPAVEEILKQEFPRFADVWPEGASRRAFLKLMGASFALAGLSSCTRQPREEIVPWVKPPEEVIPGKPLFYATAMTLGGYAKGILVESHMGRPTKVEGNPDHPASFGATDVFAQASILDLYDPDRSQVVTHNGAISTWDHFVEAMKGPMTAQKGLGGKGLRILTQTITSPSLHAKIQELLAAFPEARWHQWEPCGRDNVRLGAKIAFGRFVDTRYDLAKADVIVALDCDLLTYGPGCLRYARDFASRRRNLDRMNRLYALESCPTPTGSLADHRFALAPRAIEAIAAALAVEMGIEAPAQPDDALPAAKVRAIALDLKNHRGASIVVAGEHMSPELHALCHAINEALGNVGATVIHTEPVEPAPVDQLQSITDLVHDMAAGSVDLLLAIGGNPVYDAPADLKLAGALSKVPLRVRLGAYDDETSELCHWHLPMAHELESWGDARAFDGTATVIQPLIAPLYDGKTAYHVLGALLEKPASDHDAVKAHWKERTGEGFDDLWRRMLHDGVVAGSASEPIAVDLGDVGAPLRDWKTRLAARFGFELVLRSDPTVHDGRFANNGWLQELPKPISKLVWDNALLVSPKTASEMRIDNGSVVAVGPASPTAWIVPGHADGCATLSLGYGRTRGGRLLDGRGINAYVLLTSRALRNPELAALAPSPARRVLTTTQDHGSMEGRHLVRTATVAEYREEPHRIKEMVEAPKPGESMYPGFEYKDNAWGLAVDLNVCTGCNSCVVACQAENNIPIVGKEQVQNGREMHWIRIDRYYESTGPGDIDAPRIHHQPVMCMHCEQAPCEVVCPVGATVHSAEGLNEMVYNRCVGTRYCSNNCPYKVRRFNFLLWNDWKTPSLELMRNPDVTVRSRGVMEKCTYCVQRINAAKIEAEKQGRPVRDGEIVTACQQVCPTSAIVFGNINDPASRVRKLRDEPRNYGILEELNTRPRTTYQAKLGNPNPDLEKA